MPSPHMFPPAPPEFHPEFGYIWPAAHNRRMVRIALMASAFGVLVGGIVVLAMTSRANPDVAQTAMALSVVPADEPATAGNGPVKTTATPVAAPQSAAGSARSCNEQTWPYLDTRCLNEDKTHKRKPVRVLMPEAPAQSAPPQVIQAPGPEVTAAAKVTAPPKVSKVSKKREKAAKRRQRDREIVSTDRGRYMDSRSAYATPYRRVTRYGAVGTGDDQQR